MHKKSLTAEIHRGSRSALWGVLLLVPLAMGARDCERVIVGQDCERGPCADGGTAGAGGGGEDGEGCEYEGRGYAVGAEFEASDGCNTCSCTRDGEVACTDAACEGCEYGGRRYAVGDGFTSTDGCNQCGCNAGGTVACTLRACAGQVCGGLRGEPCPSDEYCSFPPEARCGAADQTGFCAPRPQACDLIYQPVCGCDDRTYGNACEAAAAGVSVVHEGECGGENGGSGSTCGGLRGLSCARGEYCNYPPDASCGRADATGVCAMIPQACTLEYNPVCGCDGMTHGNPCAAASAGVSVEYPGECDGGQSGTECGGLRGVSCARGEFCNYAPDAQCGAADQTGTCMPIPQVCTREYAPVCGCDGNTYGNACSAQAASVSIVHRGECDGGSSSGQVCGGLRGATCPRGEYCDYPTDAMCGRADATGVCAMIPQACTLEYAPVCGCDGNTYGNACAAAGASVSVEYRGECQ